MAGDESDDCGQDRVQVLASGPVKPGSTGGDQPSGTVLLDICLQVAPPCTRTRPSSMGPMLCSVDMSMISPPATCACPAVLCP